MNQELRVSKRGNTMIDYRRRHVPGPDRLREFLADPPEGLELQGGHLVPLRPLSAYRSRMIARIGGLLSRHLLRTGEPLRLGLSVHASPYGEDSCLVVDLAVTTDPDWYHPAHPRPVLAIEIMSGEPEEDGLAIGRRLLRTGSLKEIVVLHADLPLAMVWRTKTRRAMVGGPADHPDFVTGPMRLDSIGLNLDIGAIYRNERTGALA
ncbi:hypothetical protein SAE02_72730 [Skermanella aerolata]|uniref:Restriction endonuclease domain-containing protein n=1 Tax=Skermanella aerolata TaxID=393310 RepID=A0A512E334_9PROT|nr:hypothetical protein [Skermanella aerolata]KJB90263.1 hypothetical protein N826_38820 [Skermanella aerolata KACC 11604]GEO43125.1 hypothetical protein SAE02_72730 [Skermanella aerolata]